MKKRENIWKDAFSRYITVIQPFYSKFYQILGRFFQKDFFTSLSDAKLGEDVLKDIGGGDFACYLAEVVENLADILAK